MLSVGQNAPRLSPSHCPEGLPDFHALLGRSGCARACLYAFDLRYLGGYDLPKAPLIERKTLLAGCLDDVPAGGAIRYNEHIHADGEAMLESARRLRASFRAVASRPADAPPPYPIAVE